MRSSGGPIQDNVQIAAILIALILAACSASSRSSYACPRVGSKQCPSDPPFSQAELAQCEQQVAGCGPQIDSLVECDPSYIEAQCDSSGYSTTSPVSESCSSESLAVKKCEVSLISNLTGDGG